MNIYSYMLWMCVYVCTYELKIYSVPSRHWGWFFNTPADAAGASFNAFNA